MLGEDAQPEIVVESGGAGIDRVPGVVPGRFLLQGGCQQQMILDEPRMIGESVGDEGQLLLDEKVALRLPFRAAVRLFALVVGSGVQRQAILVRSRDEILPAGVRGGGQRTQGQESRQDGCRQSLDEVLPAGAGPRNHCVAVRAGGPAAPGSAFAGSPPGAGFAGSLTSCRRFSSSCFSRSSSEG